MRGMIARYGRDTDNKMMRQGSVTRFKFTHEWVFLRFLLLHHFPTRPLVAFEHY